MGRKTAEAPYQSVLLRGVVRTTIGNAIGFAMLPEMAYERSWDGANYSMQDSCGSRGTISFAGKAFVGVFRNDKSERCPWHSKKPYDVEPYFAGIPHDLRQLADKQCLRYVLDEFEGKTFPVITCAFWGDGISERVQAAESWWAMQEHGARLTAEDFMTDDEAFEYLEENFEMPAEGVELARSIFERKWAVGDRTLNLTAEDMSVLREIAAGKAGLQEARELFEAVKIRIPRTA